MAVVTVGLKLASDLVIAVHPEIDYSKGGSSLVDSDIKLIHLNGFSKNRVEVTGGHGITHNVDKALWDKWLQQNKETKLVKGGYIFAHESNEKAKAEAKEKKDTKSGTEKLKQNSAGVETAKETTEK